MPILGISIGTRRNGIAVIDTGELKEAQIHTFNERWSKWKLAAIVSIFRRYMQQYNIEQVIIKSPKQSHYSLALKHLIAAVDAYVKSKGCLVEYMDFSQIKQHEPDIRNKLHLRELVVSRYPVLKREFIKDSRNRQPYYVKLFEAVVVADITDRKRCDQ
jgi:hypothetical protein